jgi:hypothetical protein
MLPYYGKAPSTQPATPGEDPFENAGRLVEEMLANSAPQPRPEPSRPSPANVILGSLADALNARATVMAGGAPPQEGSFSREQRMRREAFEAQMDTWRQQQTEMANELTKFKVRALEQERDAAVREAAAQRGAVLTDHLLRKRDRENDERTADRMAEDDHRDAAIATQRWKRDTLMQLKKDAMAGGIDPTMIPSDPSKLTEEDIIGLGELVGAATGQPSNVQRMQSQIESARAVDPKMRPSAVRFTGEGGVANVEMRLDPTETLTDTDRRQAMNAGIIVYDEDGNPRPAKDVHNDISAAKLAEREQRDLERKARLDRQANPKISGTVGMKIAENLDMAKKARAALAMLGDDGFAPGGPVSGRLNAEARYQIASLRYGQAEATKLREFDARLQNVFNVEQKIRSGAAVTQPEEIRNRYELPTITNTRGTMVARLKLVAEFHEDLVRQIQRVFKLTDDDVKYLGDALDAPEIVQTPLREDDIVIFGGDGDR